MSKSSPLTQPAPLAPESAALPAPGAAWGAASRWPLPWVAVGVAAGAALLAALLAWALARGWASPAWAAPVAAALGVLLAVLPAAWALHRLLARSTVPALVSGTLHSPLGTTRPLFLELAGREWARARRYGSGAALLLVDVDRFARLSEARGSDAADAVLTEMLRMTAPTLRGADLLTRFSESQMAVFLAHADATGALDVAERIRERSEQMQVPFDHEGLARPLRITVSVGVAQLRPAHLNLQALLDDAQDAVLASRQAGGNCVRAAPVDLGRLNATGGWRSDQRTRPR
jgi:diguanylate cyclase